MRRRARIAIEICAYDQAPWAPWLVGARWAYRVTTPAGNVITGATKRNRADAEREAEACARKLAEEYAPYRRDRYGVPRAARDRSWLENLERVSVMS